MRHRHHFSQTPKQHIDKWNVFSDCRRHSKKGLLILSRTGFWIAGWGQRESVDEWETYCIYREG
jgi:hypothetical protein